jgi:hypothetical protein
LFVLGLKAIRPSSDAEVTGPADKTHVAHQTHFRCDLVFDGGSNANVVVHVLPEGLSSKAASGGELTSG